MKNLYHYVLVFLIFLVVLTACSKKSTKPEPVYRDPLSFEIFQAFEGQPLDSSYVEKIHDTWENVLKDDETIKNHTWLVGDYRVFVYLHLYSYIGTSYYETLFFTTTQPTGSTDKIHTTNTVFETGFHQPPVTLIKIKTFVDVNDYSPIENEGQAESVMIDYLNEYISEYDTLSDRSLINNLKNHLAGDDIRDWDDHSIFLEPPSDFGGAIIINKLTSKLDFLGSSVFMGHGKRYFPTD